MAGYHPLYSDYATSRSAVGAFDLRWRHFHPQLSVDQVQHQPIANASANHSLVNPEGSHSSLLMQVNVCVLGVCAHMLMCII